MDNAIRKSKQTKKSKKNKPRFRRLFILLFLIIIIAALVLASRLYKIKKIAVTTDGKNVSAEEIKSLSNLSVGMNMFEFNTNKVEENILLNKYLKSVDVKRKINGTVEITVKERFPKFKINYAGGFIIIDSEGYVLEITSEDYDVPLLLGVSTDFSSLTVGSSENRINKLNEEDMNKLSMASDIIDTAKNNDVGSLISGIDISNDRNYIVYLDSEQKIVYLGDCSELNTRILCMKEIIKAESGNKGEIFIDKDLNSSKPRFKESV